MKYRKYMWQEITTELDSVATPIPGRQYMVFDPIFGKPVLAVYENVHWHAAVWNTQFNIWTTQEIHPTHLMPVIGEPPNE